VAGVVSSWNNRRTWGRNYQFLPDLDFIAIHPEKLRQLISITPKCLLLTPESSDLAALVETNGKIPIGVRDDRIVRSQKVQCCIDICMGRWRERRFEIFLKGLHMSFVEASSSPKILVQNM